MFDFYFVEIKKAAVTNSSDIWVRTTDQSGPGDLPIRTVDRYGPHMDRPLDLDQFSQMNK